MITFFPVPDSKNFFVIQSTCPIPPADLKKFQWVTGNPENTKVANNLSGNFIGPRPEMITPWSTNAVEILQNMGIAYVTRMETLFHEDCIENFDPMLQARFTHPDQDIFKSSLVRQSVISIDDIEEYNNAEGLALSSEEISYLKYVAKKLGRKLTDSEIFGFSQVNSEHCRHKIFNGQFIIDGKEMPESLFALIKKTTTNNRGRVISAYKDNVAFFDGGEATLFYPLKPNCPSSFITRKEELVISLKAETHNFPTTVEPFYGASTGSGGEIRDRMAGGTGSMPLTGFAVYMTSSTNGFIEEDADVKNKGRFLYHNPADILIKASNGASDFGNKFGQPLTLGSLFTFEHDENNYLQAFDKVIMLAGGVGYGVKKHALKGVPQKGQKLIMMGGDNYRIGMGGGAVSSVETGKFSTQVELNAVQRANPEMQKRVYNVIRALAETDENPIVSVHDHGAGGHLNCFSELMEETGGTVYLDRLPIGDPSLSDKEIIGNESQERMGLLVEEQAVNTMEEIAARERAPFYVVGETFKNKKLTFVHDNEDSPFNLKLEYLFGQPPKTVLNDKTTDTQYSEPGYILGDFVRHLEKVLQNEAVACKDWLTNKVDRSVTGKVARQQSCGQIQLPLNNYSITALDYDGKSGIVASIGHAPAAALIDAEKGSRLAVAEAITNIMWAPVSDGLKGISLSANWMWPSKNPGEDARLYSAVKALSDFCIELGVNVPTGKDSLSMTQQYPDGTKVKAPGTVIVSAGAHTPNHTKSVTTNLKNIPGSMIFYIDMSGMAPALGGSVFYSTLNALGKECPDIVDSAYFAKVFDVIQNLINRNKILAGHDISSGGLITTLLEMCFPTPDVGLDINLSAIPENDITALLFSENPGIVFQTAYPKSVVDFLCSHGITFYPIAKVLNNREFKIIKNIKYEYFNIDELRDIWYKKSYLFDRRQAGPEKAKQRFENYKHQKLEFVFPENFQKILSDKNFPFAVDAERKWKAAIIREKGVNGDREMAWSLYLAGFEVVDIHMTDLITGRANLEDINMLVFVGGFSNSDVLGSAKGWAAGFLYNEKARKALDHFYARKDTLSLGVCNGCQLMVELGVLYPDHENKPVMKWNESHKFESGFINVDVPENNSVMLGSLAGTRLGVWVAHGEGKFSLQGKEDDYNVVMKYSHHVYPGNPNGSDFDTAALASVDGRHLAMMPHIERSVYNWQWAHYPEEFHCFQYSPWTLAFRNAFQWLNNHVQ